MSKLSSEQTGLVYTGVLKSPGELIEVYKTLFGLDKVDVERMFPLVGEPRTRGCYVSGGCCWGLYGLVH